MDAVSAWYDGWAVTKSFPGHKGRPGLRGGSLSRSEIFLKRVTPAGNLEDIEMGRGGSLWEATMKRGPFTGSKVGLFMYSPRTNTLLAGLPSQAQASHMDLYDLYGKQSGSSYDDFVKMYWNKDTGTLDIFSDRHTAKDDTDGRDKAFRAARAMGRAGYPSSIPVRIAPWEELLGFEGEKSPPSPKRLGVYREMRRAWYEGWPVP